MRGIYRSTVLPSRLAQALYDSGEEAARGTAEKRPGNFYTYVKSFDKDILRGLITLHSPCCEGIHPLQNYLPSGTSLTVNLCVLFFNLRLKINEGGVSTWNIINNGNYAFSEPSLHETLHSMRIEWTYCLGPQ